MPRYEIFSYTCTPTWCHAIRSSSGSGPGVGWGLMTSFGSRHGDYIPTLWYLLLRFHTNLRPDKTGTQQKNESTQEAHEAGKQQEHHPPHLPDVNADDVEMMMVMMMMMMMMMVVTMMTMTMMIMMILVMMKATMMMMVMLMMVMTMMMLILMMLIMMMTL